MSFAEQKEYGFMRIPKWMPWQDKLALIVLKAGFFFFLLIFVLLLSSQVFAVECGATPTDDCTVSSSTVFNAGTYRFDDKDKDGAIAISANNLELDCNGARFIGNGTVSSVGIRINTRNNVTLRNCYFNGYATGVQIISGNTTFIKNNNITNSTRGSSSARLLDCTNCRHTYISGNRFENSSNEAIRLSTGKNITIEYNKFLRNFDTDAISIINANFSIIRRNIFGGIGYVSNMTAIKIRRTNHTLTTRNNMTNLTSSESKVDYGIVIATADSVLQGYNTFDHNITYNFISGVDIQIQVEHVNKTRILHNILRNSTETGSIYIRKLSSNVLVSNFSIFFNDIGILVANSTKINLTNGKINRSISNEDSYNSGIYISLDSSLIRVINVTIDDFGNCGLLVRQSNNLTIINNTFDPMSISNKLLASPIPNDGTEPIGNICVLELYKTFVGNSAELHSDRIEQINDYRSDNITLKTNTHLSNSQVLLRTQGTLRLTHDLAGYWFISHQFPKAYVDVDSFYISNSASILSNVFLRGVGNFTTFSQGYNSQEGRRKVNYTISNQFLFFRNANRTTGAGSETQNVTVYNLTNALAFFDNGSVIGSKDINSNDGRLDFTLLRLNWTYVLDNYNLTESLIRPHDRLSFTSASTSTLKKIASNLSQAINATVRINVAHTNIKDIVFINNNSRDYSPETWNFVGGQAEMTLNNIAPDSNTVYIDYGIQPLGQQQTIKGRGALKYITEELPISAFGNKYNLPVWVIGVGIISLGILALGLFTPISFPIVITLLAINALLIFITISRSIS